MANVTLAFLYIFLWFEFFVLVFKIRVYASHLCKLRTFKNIFTAPWLRKEHKAIGSLNAMLKFYEIKNGPFLFIYFNLSERAFYMQVYGDWQNRGRYNLNYLAF